MFEEGVILFLQTLAWGISVRCVLLFRANNAFGSMLTSWRMVFVPYIIYPPVRAKRSGTTIGISDASVAEQASWLLANQHTLNFVPHTKH